MNFLLKTNRGVIESLILLFFSLVYFNCRGVEVACSRKSSLGRAEFQLKLFTLVYPDITTLLMTTALFDPQTTGHKQLIAFP